MATITKENDGKSPYQRQRRICRITIWVLLLLGAYQILVAHFLAGFVPDIEIDKETGRKRVRRRPELHKKNDGTIRSPYDGIIEGHLQLIDIQIPDNINNDGSDAAAVFTGSRYNVKGIFCVLEWSKQQEDPSSVPLFDDLVRESTMCATTRHTADLYQVVQGARKWDYHFRNITLTKRIEKRQRQKHLPQPEAEAIERSIPPTALIFHESRCGSTLVSNILASFTPDGSSRVYSEAAPPIKALEACPFGDDNNNYDNNNNNNCNPLLHQQLIRDVFYMMGRTELRGPEQNYLFYKLQSRAVHYLPLLEAAFDPEPMPAWMYLYRDNVHVMQSHFQGSVTDPASEERNVLGQKKPPKCLDGFQGDASAGLSKQGEQGQQEESQELQIQKEAQQQQQSPSKALQTFVAAKGKTVDSLSQEEYCAANLASLSESAIHHYEQLTRLQLKTPHFFINYRQLPDIIWDHVLPTLGVELRAKDIHRMEKVAAVYTQGRTGGKKTGGGGGGIKIFTGDSHHKEANVPFPIAQAVQDFMDPTFEKLEALASKTLKTPVEP